MRRFVASSRRHDRRSKLGPFVLWPIAESTGNTTLSGTSNPAVTLINEQYVYPSMPTDITAIYWDGPSDNGVTWYGFLGELQKGPEFIDRIDVRVRGYVTKSGGQISIQLILMGKTYIIGNFTNTLEIWVGGSVFGKWPFDYFITPTANARLPVADYGGPLIAISLGGSSGNKDMYVKNVQAHLYGH